MKIILLFCLILFSYERHNLHTENMWLLVEMSLYITLFSVQKSSYTNLTNATFVRIHKKYSRSICLRVTFKRCFKNQEFNFF
jgi:hypothetical protein